MIHRRSAVVIIALLVTVVVVIVVGLLVTSPPGIEESTYGYSVSLATNATLANLTLYVPLPAAENGTSPIAESVRDGTVNAPDTWQYDVIETDRGPVLRLTADEVPAERRPDGNRYSTYLFGAQRPADGVVETGEPFGREPTIAPPEGRRERPCPNVVEPDPAETCYAFDAQVYAAYDAPADALVTIYLVHTGVNTYEGSSHRHDMYYERVHVALHGRQDGWTTVAGFASTEDR